MKGELRRYGERFAIKICLRSMALLLLCCLVAGCQGSLFSYKGKKVYPGESIKLLEGEHSAYWSTRDLRINYTYSSNPGQLRISGNIIFADWLGMSFNSIVLFNLQLFLLDDQSIVLNETGLATGYNYADSRSSLSFNKTIALPPGTTAVAFGYTGEARGVGEAHSGTTSFFFVPVGR